MTIGDSDWLPLELTGILSVVCWCKGVENGTTS